LWLADIEFATEEAAQKVAAFAIRIYMSTMHPAPRHSLQLVTCIILFARGLPALQALSLNESSFKDRLLKVCIARHPAAF
jgi:hypothetical protein